MIKHCCNSEGKKGKDRGSVGGDFGREKTETQSLSMELVLFSLKM